MARAKQRGPWLDREPGLAAWYIYWYDADARRVRRRSAGTADRGQAEEGLGLFIIERARAEKPATSQSPDRYPVATALRWFLQERAPELESAPQIGFAVTHLLKFFKARTVSTLTPQLMKDYEASRPVARGTVRRELAVLSSSLNHAIKNGRLTSAPRIILPAPGKARTAHLDDAEITRLLAACRPIPHLYVWTMLALNTGARKSALLELTWTQVQFDQGLIYLNPEEREQTTKGRAVVPMSDPLRVTLRAAFDRRSEVPKNPRARRWEPSPYVVQYRGGRVLDIKKSFAEACERAGLAQVTPHTMRHTAASIMARAGIDLHVIAKVLGHSYGKTSELYAHLRPGHLQAAIDALGKATS